MPPHSAPPPRLPLLPTVAASAVLWVIAVELNNHVLFRWTEATEYRHWVFVPAGVKLIIAMVAGWRGALGVALGKLTYLKHDLPTLSLMALLPLAAGYGFVPLLAVLLFSRQTGLHRPWVGLQGHHLLLLVLLAGVIASVFFHSVLVLAGIEDLETVLPDMTQMLVGDVLGAGLLLLTVMGVRRMVRAA